MKVSVGGTEYSATNSSITGKSLTISGATQETPVIITITYSSTGNARPDGPITVTFPDVELGYSSAA